MCPPVAKVARGTLLNIGAQTWHLLAALLLYAFLARELGPVLFGRWRVVITVLDWFELFASSGLAMITAKKISEAPTGVSRLGRAGYAGQLAIALAVLAIVIVLAGPIAGLLSDPRLATLLRIAVLDVPMYGAFMLGGAVVLGLRRFQRQAIAWTIYATAKAVMIATLVAVGFSIPGALIGNALSSAVGFAAVFIPLGDDRGTIAELRQLAGAMLVAAVPFVAVALLEGLGQTVDLWSVSALVSSSALVGLYASATVIAEVPTFMFIGLNRVILPSVAGAKAEGDLRRAGDYATQAVRLSLIVTVLGVAVVAGAGRQVLTLVYSSRYTGAFVPLVLLMVAAMGRTVRTTCTEVLMAWDRRRVALAMLVVTVALELALLAVLTGTFGLDGAALSAAVSALAAGTWGALALRGATGGRPLATLARCAVAGAAVALALAASAPPPLALLVAVPLAGAVYLLLLWLLREFSPEDFASVRSALRRPG